jgi:hypothetical protein
VEKSTAPGKHLKNVGAAINENSIGRVSFYVDVTGG